MNPPRSFGAFFDEEKEVLVFTPEEFNTTLRAFSTSCLMQALSLISYSQNIAKHSSPSQSDKSTLPFEMLLARAIALQEKNDRNLPQEVVETRSEDIAEWMNAYFEEVASAAIPEVEIVEALLSIKAFLQIRPLFLDQDLESSEEVDSLVNDLFEAMIAQAQGQIEDLDFEEDEDLD